MTTHAGLYPVAAVCRRTGLSPDVLRVWERRYGVVQPARSAGGQRLYSEADLDRLRMLARATEAGFAIGRVARMPVQELAALLSQAAGVEAPAPDPATERCLDAALRFDAPAIVAELERAGLELGTLELVRRVIAPLFEALGQCWEAGTLDPAQEHLATSAVRSYLLRAAALRSLSRPLVVATPAGQRHEIGALLAAVVSAAEGWRTVYLGPDLPAASIALAARTVTARAVLLSVVCSDPWPEGELRTLRAQLPGVPLLVGGRAAVGLRPLAAAIGLEVVEDLGDLRRRLGYLGELDQTATA